MSVVKMGVVGVVWRSIYRITWTTRGLVRERLGLCREKGRFMRLRSEELSQSST